MKTILAVFLLFASSVLFAQSNDRQGELVQVRPSTEPAPTKTSIDSAKEADIRRLLDVTGAKALMLQRMANMEGMIRPLLTSSLPPGEYRAKLTDLFFEKFHSKTDPEVLINLAIPVYDKYLSDDEIKGLLDFYSTPLGKKMIVVLPQLTSECAGAGEKWGKEMGRQPMIEVLEEHPDLKEALENAKGSAPPQ